MNMQTGFALLLCVFCLCISVYCLVSYLKDRKNKDSVYLRA